MAAADIGGTRLRMMLADLGGAVVAEWSAVLGEEGKTPAAVGAMIQQGLMVMCEDSGTPANRVLHLTAGAPGITNAMTGVVLSAPNLTAWHEVPLREVLQRVTGLPVAVENDTNLAASGEYARGVARGVEDFVFIAVGTGVGAGIFLRGELHRGAQWCAGEMGYFGVSGRVREPTRMRHTGQLEGLIGGGGIEQEWRKRLDQRPAPVRAGLGTLRANQILDLARDGDPLAAEVVTDVAGLLADAVLDVSLLLNPALVVLGGGVGSHAELCRATEALLQRHEFARPALRSSSLGTGAQLFGAISVSIAAAEAQLRV